MENKLLDLIEMVYKFSLQISSAFDCGGSYTDSSEDSCEESLCNFKNQCKKSVEIDKLIKEIRAQKPAELAATGAESGTGPAPEILENNPICWYCKNIGIDKSSCRLECLHFDKFVGRRLSTI